MSLIGLVVVLIIVGILLYLINQFIPMDPKIKKVLNIVDVVIVVIWLLGIFFGYGKFGGAENIQVPTFHQHR